MKPETNEATTQNTTSSTTNTPPTTAANEAQNTPQTAQREESAETDATAQPSSEKNGSSLGEIPDEDADVTADPVEPDATGNAGVDGEEAAEPEGAAPESAAQEEATQENAEESAESKRIAELEEKLAAAETRAEEMFERLQRTTAEFQNSQRRREKQALDQMDRANSRLIERLLPVLDDFELAFRNMPEEFRTDENGWIVGLQQIDKKMQRLLEDEQMTIIKPSGEFDPNRHEAVSSEPSEEVESGHIIETLRTGYEYKGRVMRPALVRVAL